MVKSGWEAVQFSFESVTGVARRTRRLRPGVHWVTGADRGCEGPHAEPLEGRVLHTNPVPTSTWPDE